MRLILQIDTIFIDEAESLQYAIKERISEATFCGSVVERSISKRKVIHVGSTPVAITQYFLSRPCSIR